MKNKGQEGLFSGLTLGIFVMTLVAFIIQLVALIRSDPSFSIYYFIGSGVLVLAMVIIGWVYYIREDKTEE